MRGLDPESVTGGCATRARAGWWLCAILLVAAAALLCPGCGGAPSSRPGSSEEERDLAFFLERLVDLDGLPVLEDGVRTAQFSSFDRRSRRDPLTGGYQDWDSNGDHGNYLRVDRETGEAVMAEMEGPGCVWRIWSANPTGRIRFYLDGASTPTLELDFKEMFHGKGFPFPRPLLWQRAADEGGENAASISCVPIPFARSCRITADKAHDQYYHVGYSTFPADWRVKTLRLPLTDRESAVVEDVAAILRGCGRDPGAADESAPGASKAGASGLPPEGSDASAGVRAIKLEPGAPVVLGEYEGPGTIEEFRAKLRSPERWAGRKVLLQMSWDAEERPSVDVPLSDFFGDPWEEAPYCSLPMGIADDLNYCLWRMPFARSARIVVTNQGSLPATLTYAVRVRGGDLAPGTARFHAKWRRDRKSDDFDYPVLECRGRGRLVGVALFPDNIVGEWWGEGDEKMTVDGEPFPSIFGTGSEDYFGDAWGIRRFATPFHGCPTRTPPGVGRRQSCYRWHVADSVPFETSLRVTIENYAALRADALRNDYSSVAYWYQLPGGDDIFRSPDVEDRIPQGPVVPGAIEAEAVVGPAGADRIVTDAALPDELSGGRGVALSLESGSAAFRLPVARDGDYLVEAVMSPASRADSVALFLAGERVGGRVHLTAGESEVEARLEGTQAAGDDAIIDFFLLHPFRNRVTEWYLIGPFPNARDAGIDQPFGPETQSFRADAAYPGKREEVRWRRIVAPGGIVRDLRWIGDGEDFVAYACCEIVAPEARQATFFVGSDDGVKVWVNGELVHSSHRHRVVTPDEDSFDAPLVKGRNRVLLKVDQGGGPWGFVLRIDDPAGELRYALPGTER